METGQFILTFLLLIILIALGFPYSEEVSSNRRLRGHLKRYQQKPSNCGKPKGPLSQLIDTAKDNRIEELEGQVERRDEMIKRLSGDIAQLKFDYAAEVAGRNDEKPISDAEKSALLYGEWVDNSEPNPDENIDGRV